MNKYKGFTLIELIVVIAIIGILCALLIPTMMGWTAKSRISSNNSNAKELYNGLMSASVSLEDKGGAVTSGVLAVNCNNIESFPNFSCGLLTQSECEELFKSVDEKYEDTSKSIWLGNFDISQECVLTGVVFAQKSNKYCGGYPVSCPEETRYATGSATNLQDCLDYASGYSPWPMN